MAITHDKGDWMKYCPVLCTIVGLIATASVLQYRVGHTEEELKEQKVWLIKQSQDNTTIKINQARQDQKLDDIISAIKELKR